MTWLGRRLHANDKDNRTADVSAGQVTCEEAHRRDARILEQFG